MIKTLLWIALVICLSMSLAQGGEATSAVATYECIGLYHTAELDGPCQVCYRPKGSQTWKRGLDLVYDARDGQYRGSLVGLISDTEYEIELFVKGANAKKTIQVRTRSDQFPIGRVTRLEPGPQREPIRITESGTPEAYHLVVAEGQTTIDVMNAADFNLKVDANYVIIRGLELKNAARHGILIGRGQHDIVIEDCHITYWGRAPGHQLEQLGRWQRHSLQ